MAVDLVDQVELGRRLEIVRTYRGMTLKEVEERTAEIGMKVTMSTLSGYERGQRWPYMEKLATLCACYGLVDSAALLSSRPDWFEAVLSDRPKPEELSSQTLPEAA